MGERPFDALIDARGLSCPLPLLKARQALMVLEAGARICVLATDPAARRDFEDFAEASGNGLLGIDEEDGLFRIVVEKV
ncbi:MAG: sulfurtransferase TusA family protein [Geminicoccaceae bacterium]|nr:sulfurtransferase TusA family protein [Geminicoccaceae bacterium]